MAKRTAKKAARTTVYAQEHAENPCTICGAAPGVKCEHDEPLPRARRKASNPKLWIVYTLDLGYNITGAGETKEQAKQVVWDEFKRTKNSGYGMPAGVRTLEEFYDWTTWRAYHLAAGEVDKE